MISDIIEVPLPLAASSRLINFFTFHISMFFSASLACGCELIMATQDQAPLKAVNNKLRATVTAQSTGQGSKGDKKR